MVEQEAVNFEVASSSLAGGAMLKFKETRGSLFVDRLEPRGASLAGGAMLKFKETRGSLFVDICLTQPFHHHETVVISLHFLWVGAP